MAEPCNTGHHWSCWYASFVLLLVDCANASGELLSPGFDYRFDALRFGEQEDALSKAFSTLLHGGVMDILSLLEAFVPVLRIIVRHIVVTFAPFEP